MTRAKKIGSTLLTALASLALLAPTAAYAAEGYRGSEVNGCQAFIKGRQAWTNCKPATASGLLATKAWCTAQPTRTGNWSSISQGSHATGLSKTGCAANVHSGQTLWQ